MNTCSRLVGFLLLLVLCCNSVDPFKGCHKCYRIVNQFCHQMNLRNYTTIKFVFQKDISIQPVYMYMIIFVEYKDKFDSLLIRNETIEYHLEKIQIYCETTLEFSYGQEENKTIVS
ncbi:hypothetical protein RF11_10578 [Thelohanellus kitauei]|uniref:Uncharacterized protein n=1 Tax=Thelohanellus kitauei TaxID=669202 RepID=A0A0C2JYC2_THEKT|nr:hypothetical protein RF11_10578 [Thelohanellus kitauei]